MKFSTLRTLVVAAALSGTPALADSFSFSYSFLSSSTQVTGTFTGDQNGSLVENISDLALAVDGTDVAASFFSAGFDGSDWVAVPIVSFDPLLNNFAFADSDISTGDFGTYLFYMVHGSSWVGTLLQTPELFDFDPADAPGLWKLTNLSSPTSVADGGTTATLLLLTLAGVGLLRRR